MNDLAGKLGVDVQPGDVDLSAEDLSNVMIQRAKEAGKTEAEINAAFEEWLKSIFKLKVNISIPILMPHIYFS